MSKHTHIAVVAALTGSLVLPWPTQINAQAGPGVVYTVILPAAEFGSQNFTALLANGLAAAHQFCSGLDREYQLDCLAERIDAVAKQIPKDSDYAEIQDTLDDAADKINALARANRDRALPVGNASSGGVPATTRPLTPVSASSLASVNTQALAILQDTETQLLRSASTSESKKIHYQRIADALGSNKVLLRSA